jgi:hypothetical protein
VPKKLLKVKKSASKVQRTPVNRHARSPLLLLLLAHTKTSPMDYHVVLLLLCFLAQLGDSDPVTKEVKCGVRQLAYDYGKHLLGPHRTSGHQRLHDGLELGECGVSAGTYKFDLPCCVILIAEFAFF